jgi:cytochrome c peroxidase
VETHRSLIIVVSVPVILALALAGGCKVSEKLSAATAKPAVAIPSVPLGLPPVPVPADNPMTAGKVELGKMLYFDKRLSKNKDIACATCHDPTLAWTEHEATSLGIHGQRGDRNSPTVINAAYMPAQFWDGRAASLEEQALGPIQNPIEMGNTMDACLGTLNKIPAYQKRFKAVFGSDKLTDKGMAQAIAAFERTVLSGNSPYDQFKVSQQNALTDGQKRGMDIFLDKGQCSTCHSPPLFSNGNYYNAGVGGDKDAGRKKVTKRDADVGKFRVPPLREVANTYPYFHDGSAARLEDAVKLMASGGIDNPNLSSVLKSVRDAKLTDQDVKDLVEFLGALSGECPKIEPPALPE